VAQLYPSGSRGDRVGLTAVQGTGALARDTAAKAALAAHNTTSVHSRTDTSLWQCLADLPQAHSYGMFVSAEFSTLSFADCAELLSHPKDEYHQSNESTNKARRHHCLTAMPHRFSGAKGVFGLNLLMELAGLFGLC
jgi:hypothetical protein